MDYSDEILTLESQIEELNTKKSQLLADNQTLQEKDGVKDLIALKKKDEEYGKITEELTANTINDNT